MGKRLASSWQAMGKRLFKTWGIGPWTSGWQAVVFFNIGKNY